MAASAISLVVGDTAAVSLMRRSGDYDADIESFTDCIVFFRVGA